ncbi:MAG: 4Fe-4S binding protein [Desulfobacteraceae bacterium]|nr:4Fe-4S binding protein [Desulfobacteraceae bacterium]
MDKKTLIIDHFECWGCKACEVACKQENNAPDGIKLIEIVEDGPRMAGEQPFFEYHVRVCRHCEDPPCVAECPVAAITRRSDHMVILDTAECTGCEACIDACPYDAISFDEANGVARKCNMCSSRVNQGLIPACADNICLARCIQFTSTFDST